MSLLVLSIVVLALAIALSVLVFVSYRKRLQALNLDNQVIAGTD